MANGTKTLRVYNIIENTNNNEKNYWQPIGIAFINRDGSINVKLNSLPLNGSLHIREKMREPGEEG